MVQYLISCLYSVESPVSVADPIAVVVLESAVIKISRRISCNGNLLLVLRKIIALNQEFQLPMTK